MTQDEIIRMALEAGFDVDEGLFPFEATEDKYIGTSYNLERFAALVAAHEREKQAKQEPLDDNARDNMLLWMIQRHFPSLPLSDEHTDWGRWLGFANAVFEAGRKDAAPVRTKDLTDDEIQKWIDVLMYDPPEWALKRFARAVIAADREKNK